MRISDHVANYILQMLNETDGIAEIQRNELANILGCVPSQITNAAEKLQNHIPNVFPLGYKYRQQRTQMQQHIKELRNFRRAGHSQQMFRDSQMAGTAHRKKFRYSLNNSQKNRLNQ